MGILITLFWIWLTCVIIGWLLVGCYWLYARLLDLQDYLNAKLNKAFKIQ